MSTPTQSIYDHPLYYDILFGWDRTQEADFYESAFHHFGIDKCEPLLEVACGSGQLSRVLARRGWKLTGLDSREPMLAFLREQSAALGVTVDTRCDDMADFHCEIPFGAAFNPLSSFLLLSSDAMARAHLGAMAVAVRPGGLYVLDLGFHTTERPDTETTDETWTETRGDISVRAEDAAVFVDDAGTQHVLPWGSPQHLRAVTSQWLEQQIDSVGHFKLESWHMESGRSATGVSQWKLDFRSEPPIVGRAMVVLRRTSER